MWILYCLCLVALAAGQGVERLPPSVTKNPERKIIFRESQKVTLACSATGTPPITFEWKRNGKHRSTTGSASTSLGVSVGDVTISNATRADNGFYQCFATNKYGTALSTVTHIQVAFLQDASQNHVNIRVQEGHPFVIPAARINSFPTPTYSWETATGNIDSNPIKYLLSQRVRDAWNGDLHFAYALKEDELNGRIYKSIIYNAYTDQRVDGSYTRVFVTQGSGPPPGFPPNITYFAKRQEVVLIGGTLELKCYVSGKPFPNITWSRPGKSLPYGPDIIPDTHYKTLLKITNITESEGGDYICTAENLNGTASHTFNILVEAAPVFIQQSDIPRNVNVTEGDSITFNCSAFAKPNATVVWLRNGEPINVTNVPVRFVFSSDNRSLTIRNVCRDCVDRESKTDLMVIQCNASNIHGYAFAQGYLNVKNYSQRYDADEHPIAWNRTSAGEKVSQPSTGDTTDDL